MSVAIKRNVEVSETHYVHFYRDRRFLSGALLEYIKVGIEKNEGIIVIATEAHMIELCRVLPRKIISETRFVDAECLLKNIFPKGILNSSLFVEQISTVLEEMKGHYKRNRVFVEFVDLLCERNNKEAAIELEEHWNRFLIGRNDLIVMCSYNMNNLTQDEYRKILDSHSFSSGNDDECSSVDSLCRKISALEIRNSEARLHPSKDSKAVDLKKRVVHSLKLSDLGEITAGLSHELMNPLAIIGGYSKTMTMALEDEEFESKVFLETQLAGINATVNRMASMVRNILKYSSSTITKKDFLILDAIVDAVEMVNPILKVQNVSVQVMASSDQIYMHGDSGQILQIIFNLLTNARDAIFEAHGTNGGIIHIKLEACGQNTFKIICSDNGKGISQEILGSMWRPFYTTKPVGKGTGLGLSIIQKIILDNEGTINCHSTPDQGTTFTISLPRVFRN